MCVHLVIMLAGGRKCKALSPETIERVREAVKAGHSFVVGDCYGADTLFQHLLYSLGAKFWVYHIGRCARNNPHDVESIRVPGNRYTDKDVGMRIVSSHIIHEPVGAGRGTLASVKWFASR